MNKEELRKQLLKDKTSYNEESFEMLEKLLQYTLIENEKLNLTAIKDEESFRELMIYDSLIPNKYFDFNNKKVLDLGTGAGFPGLPLLITNPNIDLTLLDSTSKKIKHIENFLKANNLKAKTVSARAEEFAQNNREAYDIVISRAVSQLNILLELSIPLLKVGGLLLALKGKRWEEELKESKKALEKLGCEVVESHIDQLSNDEERCLLVIRKNKKTNEKYPRSFGEIKNKPL